MPSCSQRTQACPSAGRRREIAILASEPRRHKEARGRGTTHLVNQLLLEGLEERVLRQSLQCRVRGRKKSVWPARYPVLESRFLVSGGVKRRRSNVIHRVAPPQLPVLLQGATRNLLPDQALGELPFRCVRSLGAIVFPNVGFCPRFARVVWYIGDLLVFLCQYARQLHQPLRELPLPPAGHPLTLCHFRVSGTEASSLGTTAAVTTSLSRKRKREAAKGHTAGKTWRRSWHRNPSRPHPTNETRREERRGGKISSQDRSRERFLP
mmetsp:Transcript_4851/g.14478  ORF Transcript_4851/g.14478 Transcript_4851/m.14478 type:complete len:266 (+) Transcript_4851:1466-2263(+)